VTSSRPTIGVIDDDQSVRKALRRLFRTAGLDVAAYATAEEYLEQRDRAGAGCLVVDVRLPGIGGLELQQQLAARPAPPILFITAHEDEEVRRLALARGAIGFFLKPFDNRQLLEAVFWALGHGDEPQPPKQ
jgi:FixJ family two-component response regulator